MKKTIRLIRLLAVMLAAILAVAAANAEDACPKCGSTSLNTSYKYINAKTHTKYFACKDCKHKWTISEAHTAKKVSSKEPTCTEFGYADGEICKYCEQPINGTKKYSALGHDLYYWDPIDNMKHTANCHRCGVRKTVDCAMQKWTIGGEKHGFCPICGRFDNDQIYSIHDSVIHGLVRGGLTGKRTIVRGLAMSGEAAALDGWTDGNAAPLFLFTAVRENKGAISPLNGECEISVPMDVPDGARLLHLEDNGTWAEKEYTVQNGAIVFTGTETGLFMLVNTVPVMENAA